MSDNTTYHEIFDIWLKTPENERLDRSVNHICGKISSSSNSHIDYEQLQSFVKNVHIRFKLRWKAVNRTKRDFISRYGAWLSTNIEISQFIYKKPKEKLEAGRPLKAFNESSQKTKARRAKQVLKSVSTEELYLAAEKKLRSTGKRDSASIASELFNTSPQRGSNIKKARISNEIVKSLSPQEALAMMIDTNLSTNAYRSMRNHVQHLYPKLYPCYDLVQNAKLLCYPDKINVDEISAEVNLQSLLDHTLSRLCLALEDVLLSTSSFNQELHFLVKWGCDGSTQTQYKQKFFQENLSDMSLFSISLVPLQLFCTKNNCKRIIWQNPAPSSPKYCRPIKLIFTKETTETITKEVKNIDDQILLLTPTIIETNKLNLSIKSILILSMIDGKVCNALSGNSSTQSCYICKAKPSEMNNEKALSQKIINQKALSFGMSPLHSWIKFMECLLHISYKLEVRKWRVTQTDDKIKVEQKKCLIQSKFKSETGLLIDMPSPKGGNTNDGNTARRFFRDSEITARITGLNLELIKRFHILLETMGSGYSINSTAFQEYADKTRKLYLKEYPWYCMPATVHKVLYHSKQIIDTCILPIGQLSEEALEARNKHQRNYREYFTRKTSRTDSNRDLMNRLLITSDPYINSLRRPPVYKKAALTPEVLHLLESPEIPEENHEF